MKRSAIIICLVFLVSSSFGQLKILDNNNIGINTDNPLSKVSVGNDGDARFVFNIYSNQSTDYTRGLYVNLGTAAYRRYTIQGSTTSGYGYAYGILGSSYSSTASSGRAYGLYGQAGNSTSGYNYAVYGRLLGSNNGAGIYGTTSGDIGVTGKYAGYFYGDVKITGNAWVNGSTVVTSDIRAKKEIKNLDQGNIQKIKELNGIKYKLKNPYEMDLENAEKASGKDSTKTVVMTAEMEKVFNKERIGLSAQELELVYPELVVESQDGSLGIDYIGLIPILIEAIKEQQIEIDALKASVQKSAKSK